MPELTSYERRIITLARGLAGRDPSADADQIGAYAMAFGEAKVLLAELAAIAERLSIAD